MTQKKLALYDTTIGYDPSKQYGLIGPAGVQIRNLPMVFVTRTRHSKGEFIGYLERQIELLVQKGIVEEAVGKLVGTSAGQPRGSKEPIAVDHELREARLNSISMFDYVVEMFGKK